MTEDNNSKNGIVYLLDRYCLQWKFIEAKISEVKKRMNDGTLTPCPSFQHYHYTVDDAFSKDR